jgi:glycosyltransferase involved in cell wall biosynthesis
MRVAYLSPSGQLGGAERCLLDVLAGIREAEPDWPLHLVVAADGPLRTRAEALGVRCSILAFPRAFSRLGESGTGRRNVLGAAGRLAAAGPAAASYLRRLRRTLGTLAPDAVHSNGLKMHVLAGWAAPRGVPVIWHLHDYVGRRPATKRLLRLGLGRCAVIVANSSSVAADAQIVFGAARRILAIHNGVDLSVFTPDGATLDLDRLAGMPAAEPDVVRVGLVATMARWKGHELFFRALSLLDPTMPVRGYVIGGAIYQTDRSQYSVEELRQRAQKSGVADRVGFTGFVAEPAAAMRALDIVVHASTAPEPFGLVVAEAMACGRPVVLSSASGVAELLVAGRDALTYPSAGAAELAAHIATLVADRAMRVRLGRQARQVALAGFDRRRVSNQWLSIYRELTIRGGSGAA